MSERSELIARQASKLSIEERRSLIMQIEQSIGDDIIRVTIENRYNLLVAAAEATVGHKMNPDKRHSEDVLIRQFVAYRLRQDGYSFPKIAKVMNKNHSTIMTLCNRMNDYFELPNIYATELELYQIFENLISTFSI